MKLSHSPDTFVLQRYSNHDIVNFLESIGASFGACQNAYTSADETVYTLMVPTADLALLDKSIAVLSEFAARIRYVRVCMCTLQVDCSAV
jgi:predicted Zn-dependent peptidase